MNRADASHECAPAEPVRPRERCALTGYVPGAFNVKVQCNHWRGHAGQCDFSNGWGRVGAFARSVGP